MLLSEESKMDYTYGKEESVRTEIVRFFYLLPREPIGDIDDPDAFIVVFRMGGSR